MVGFRWGNISPQVPIQQIKRGRNCQGCSVREAQSILTDSLSKKERKGVSCRVCVLQVWRMRTKKVAVGFPRVSSGSSSCHTHQSGLFLPPITAGGFSYQRAAWPGIVSLGYKMGGKWLFHHSISNTVAEIAFYLVQIQYTHIYNSA